MLAYTSFSPNAERTQVTANIQLKDLSWQQLLDIYDAEKANPGQHTIKVQVPYAVGTTDPTEATQLASEQITVTGTFNFFASSTNPRPGLSLRYKDPGTRTVAYRLLRVRTDQDNALG